MLLKFMKQECMPVGCVPPALYRTAGSLSVQGVFCPWGSLSGRPSPPVDRMTDASKNISLPKLRLRAVITRISIMCVVQLSRLLLPLISVLQRKMFHNIYYVNTNQSNTHDALVSHGCLLSGKCTREEIWRTFMLNITLETFSSIAHYD